MARETVAYLLKMQGKMEEDTASLKGEVEGLKDEASGASEEVEGLGKSSKKSGAAMGALTAGVSAAAGGIAAVAAAAVATVKVLGDMTQEINGLVDATGTLATSTGFSNKAIAALRFQAGATGKSLEEIVPRDLAQRLFEAANNTGEAKDVFRALGFSATDAAGGLKLVDTALPELLDKIARIENPTQKTAFAIKAFGEEGRNLIGAFEDSAGFFKAMEAATQFGVDVGPEAVARTNEWLMATNALDVAWKNVKDTIVQVVGPSASETIREIAKGLIFATNVALGFAKALGEVGVASLALDILPGFLGGGGKTSILQVEQFGKAWLDAATAMEKFEQATKGAVEILSSEEMAAILGLPVRGGAGGGQPSATGVLGAPDPEIEAKRAAEEARKRRLAEFKGILAQKELQRAIEQSTISDSVLDETLRLLTGKIEDAARLTQQQIDTEERLAREAGRGQTESEILGMVAGGDLGSILSLAGPVGSILGTLGDPDVNLADQGLDLQDQVLDLLENLPNVLVDLLNADFLAKLLAGAVEVFVKTFITILPELGLVFIESLATLVTDLPEAIAKAFKALFEEFFSIFKGDRLKTAFGDLGSAIGDLLVPADVETGRRQFLGIQLPSLDREGMIRGSGLAMVHAGERITRDQSMSVSGVTVIANDPTEWVNRLRQLQGSKGIGLNLQPLVP